MEPRNARAEATAVLADGHEARVLEPSPPAVGRAPFADEPTDPAGAAGIAVSPVERPGTVSWRSVAGDRALQDFAAERWLGPFAPLPALPDSFASTRHGLWRLALHAIYRARREANGKYGLRWTLGGFGTPFFGDDEQVRVSGGVLVRQTASTMQVEPITSLRRAAEFIGLAFEAEFDHGFNDVEPAGDPDEDLGVDPIAALALGNWFGFGTSVLETVRVDHAEASLVQLWPEHFDVAMDVAYGDPVDEQRVNIGASPGDGFHADPYLYVGPWTADRPGPDDGFWNAPFGAVLGLDEIRAAGDGDAQHAQAVDFVRRGIARLRDG